MAETHYIHLGAMLHATHDVNEKVLASQSINLVTCRTCLAILESRRGGDGGQD